MTKLPRLAAEKIIKALRRAGFQEIRQRGSHVTLRHPDGGTTDMPLHRGEQV